jgi:hypothetical protein
MSEGLESIAIPGSVTDLGNGYTFSGCSGLKSAIIGNGITRIANSMFHSCHMLTSVNIPNSVTSIGNAAFGSCIKLPSITIPDSVTSIGRDAFSNCKKLTDIYFDGTVEQWNAITENINWDGGAVNCTIYCNDGTITKEQAVIV